MLAYIPEDAGNSPATDPNKGYLDQMKTVYLVDPEAVEKVDWVLVLAGSIGTVLSTIAIIGWILTFLMFVIHCLSGKQSLRNTKFWKNMLGSLIIIILFTTGVIFAFGEQMYNLLLTWGKL